MKKTAQKFRLLSIVTVLLTVVAYAVWYWCSSHLQLVNFYKNLNPNFYRAETWETTFFTENVKAAGNWWCLAAVVAALIWAFSVWKTKWQDLPKVVLEKQSALAYLGIAAAGTLLSLLANQHSAYSTDEVFSALNFASIPAFQTLSYYALPNNHMLFNAFNGSLFFWSGDLVLTGRLLSCCCFAAALCFTWFLLKNWVSPIWLRLLVLLVVALQFPIWGFSGQARGYEMVLLFSCLSFGSFYIYFKSRAQYLVILHTVCNVVGILTLPTYLYWWLGLLLASLLIQLTGRRVDWLFIRSSISGIAAAFISYLPLLTFSGLASLSENKYMRPGEATHWYFLTHLNDQHFFDGLFSEWFCSSGPGPWLGLGCLLLPVLLFFYPKNDPSRRVLGITYFSMLIAFLFMAVLMLRLPFYRNLIAHGYLAMLLMLVAIAPFFRTKAMRTCFGLALLAFAGYSAQRNFHRIPSDLYYYDVSGYYNQTSQCELDFKPNSTVYLDNECFYWWAILRETYADRHLKIKHNRPRFNLQDYCVMPLDSLPPNRVEQYRLVRRCAEHQVFERVK